MKKTIIIAILLLAALLWGKTSGNIQWTQLASGARHGTATEGQSSDGTGTSGNCAQFDSSGNIVDAGSACGTATGGNATSVNGAAVPASSLVSGTNSSRQFIAATAANIVSLFSTCSGTQYLGADGSCHTPSGGGGGLTLTGSASCSGTCTTGPGSAVVTVAGATITFGSIPGTFNHLMLIAYGRSSTASTTDNLEGRINADSSADYNWQLISGSGSTSAAAQANGQTSALLGVFAGNGATAGFSGASITDIAAYTGTTFNKMMHSRSSFSASGGSGIQVAEVSNMWLNTPAAVTSVTVLLATGSNFMAGSSFQLYGY